MQLYFATGNQHKAQEVEAILRARGADVEILMHKGEEPVESGSTFLENALIKARAAFAATGAPSFADDSGIAVEVMGGAPGIFSAIWSGGRDDKTNRDLLLAQLIDIPEENRAAAFVCTMALVDDAGEVSVTGVWPGKIATQASGEHGFGYDPIFIPQGFSVTAAELEPEVKNSFSHRAMALQQLASLLTSR
ncbi:RdgB/HAM1 family non-canonical purine NTP pyrophosphatase [Aquiluna borgnonia]|uniref:dITP/XTP pyrophosphatase n=1 Tax=Aquiluna borgnonia TaxID=2499157 RepID=A0A7D4ULY5_9MICO|nr:RdgB/HAM1 family non-canonical purine NTP pyrophosphatase [Aquiluna borgnonia]QKJ25518.1 RdgB/HAM1 family non-canonical purine NTP pyrophosphatase [Aquiluna borgnonia]